MTEELLYDKRGDVAWVTFNRPQARNALTFAMYQGLAEICGRIEKTREAKAIVITGAGDKAFAAGTDIAQFKDFRSGEDGIGYERKMDATLDIIERCPVPTIAAVSGFCTGGGIAIAGACDFRIASANAQFGVPIARTLGNCLAISNTARIVAEFGIGRAKRMLVLGDMLNVDEAIAAGFVFERCESDQIDARAAAHVDRLARNAPITMRVTKQSVSRILAALPLQGDDLVRQCYGSRDFHEGVAAFTEKRPPVWTGE